jgi:Holliday junction DNA helicase RuvB
MQMNQEEMEDIKSLLAVEAALPDYDKKLGWTWSQAAIQPSTINKYIIKKFVRVGFSSNSCTMYLVTDDARNYVESYVEPEPIVFGPVDTTHLFDSVIGYDNVKEAMKISLELDKPVHILLYGPPATAKSMMIWEIERAFGIQALAMIGSGTSKSGIWDKVADVRPKVILIDELEKMKTEDQMALLSLMEYGRIIRTKTGRELDITIITWVFATANRIHTIPPELLSRFKKFQITEYSDSQYVEVVKSVLQRSEGCSADESALIAERLVHKTHDIRDAIRVGRYTKKVGIDKAIELMIG